MKKIILATLAVALTIGVFAFGRKADQKAEGKNPPITYHFRFDSQDLNDADDPDMYVQVTSGTLPSCQGSALPCRVQFDSQITDPEEALTAYLDSFEDEEDILLNAISKRNAQ